MAIPHPKTPNGDCCCTCLDGAVVPRFLNGTTVRKTLDCDHLSTVNEVAPYARYIEGDGVHVVCTAPGLLEKVPPDWFADWLMLGDANGWSSQKISAIVDDILACAADDSTHSKIDHNCYTKSGTVDQRGERRGRRSVLSKKFWHGRFPYGATELCDNDPEVAASQTKYLKQTFRSDWEIIEFDIININPAEVTTQNLTSVNEVNPITGLISRTVTGTPSATHVGSIAADCGLQTTDCVTTSVSGTDLADYLANLATAYPDTGDHDPIWDYPTTIRQGQKLTVLASDLTGTHAKISYKYLTVGATGYTQITQTLELTLATTYTAANVLTHFYAALREWSLSNHKINAVRTAGGEYQSWMKSEELALSPLVLYDETHRAVDPGTGYDLSDDYSQAQDATDENGKNPGDPGYIPTWHKRAWIDPSGYLWQAPDGSRVDGVAYSTLLGPAFTGEIVAAGIEGGERLFWFNAVNMERVFDSDLGDPAWHWNHISTGAKSDDRLPEVTRRWMNLDETQYDGAAYRGVDTPTPSGNYPGPFLRQQNGVLVGAKYVEATQEWDAVNFDYPCGNDARFDVDQTSVCCVVSGDAGSGFRVKQTGDSTSVVPEIGNNILVEGDGIYLVTGKTSHGGTPAEWTLAVGAKIEDVPAGRSCWPNGMDALGLYGDGQHLGKLRWWTTTPTNCPTNTTPTNTGVRMEWSFDLRGPHKATPPTWIGDISGLIGFTMAEFSYNQARCPDVVGYVPFYADNEIDEPAPAEDFDRQTLFAMPDSFDFDDYYGALWIGAVEMVMPDPFWQTPFTPDCGIDYTELPRTEFLSWHEDDGSGADDYDEEGGSEETPTITHHAYYPHRRWVAARCTVPAGKSLPAGVTMLYAAGNIIAPADGVNVHFDTTSGGIIIGDDSGAYRSIERPWGFTDRACGTGNRFGDFYTTFTQCP